MTNADIEKEIASKETEIRALRSALAENTSEIGDWKIIKIYEARLQNKTDPYNLEEILTERETTRERINQLREEIENLKKKLK
jgi:hypothetical protein